MKRIGEEWIPDFESRYFTADFSYGLKVIKELCELFEVEAGNITRIWSWYQGVASENTERAFSLNLGKKEFIELY